MMKLFQPFLLVALILCLVVPAIVLAEGLIVGWKGDYLLIVLPLVVLESLWSRRVYRRARISSWWDMLGRWVVEVAVLLLLTKLVSLLVQGLPELVAEVRSWINDPRLFFAGDMIPIALLVVLVWQITLLVQGRLDCLGNPSEMWVERQAAQGTLRGFIVGGGLWMMFTSGLVVAASQYLDQFQGRLTVRVQAALFGYFGLTLLLLAHIQYIQRRFEWQRAEMRVPATVARRWVYWGLAFTVAIFFVAALLPVAYAQGPERLFGWLNTVIYFVWKVFVFIVYILLLPIFWLIRALFGSDSDGSTLVPKLTPPELPPEPLLGPVPEWWIFLRQLLTIAGIAAILGTLFRVYSRDHELPVPFAGGLLDRLSRVVRSFLTWLHSLRVRSRLAWYRIRSLRASPLDESAPASHRITLLRARTPQARIRRYYLTMLRRAAGAGLRRKPAQTPREYAASLEPHISGQEDELEILTEAFVQARYCDRELTVADVPPVHNAWRKLRSVLRRRRERSGRPDL